MKILRFKCLLLVLLLLFIRPAFAVTYIDYGVANVRVYVVALDGVDAHGVNNVGRAVGGVLDAANVSTITWVIMFVEKLYGKIRLNVTCLLVNNWDWYRDIVEVGSNIVIVNIHGETIPIPEGYSKEGWVDKIAEAMIYRNVTWVHTTGYPFYYYQSQSGERAEWGEEGFKRLMAHMGKENVTCRPPSNPEKKIYSSEFFDFVIGMNWDMAGYLAAFAERGNPLNASMFRDCSLMELWGTRDAYLTGAILRFNKPNGPKGFGLYVYIGTRKTFDAGGHETDGDYVRAHVGTAAAIYMNAYKQIVEQQISRAEEAIRKAESEGRTKGLSEAKQLLAEAIEAFHGVGDIGYVINELVEPAVKIAMKAEKPSFVEVYAKHLTLLGIIGLLSASLLIKRVNDRRRRKKNEEG